MQLLGDRIIVRKIEKKSQTGLILLDEQIEASKHLPKGEKTEIPAMSKESDLPVGDKALPF